MKKLLVVLFAASIIMACQSAPPAPPSDLENPGSGPELTVVIPELFGPDPDNADETMTVSITVTHSVPVKDWDIQVQPIRRQSGQPAAAPQRQAGTGTQRQRNRPRVFFGQNGNGSPPQEWQWNGRGTSGELVQSAMDYQFRLSVNDVFNNNAVYEGVISVDVLVRREGENLRMIVPSIVFPANSSDLSLVDEDDRRSNTRVLRLIANALNKYTEYRITVEGHANPTTAPNSRNRTNEETTELKPLSEARAKAVMDALVTDNGLDSARLSSVGIGGERTVAPYNDSEENWKNRRVEFLLQR
jgi:outer membrane protein OmpA-like peptidoglycan-associated protein